MRVLCRRTNKEYTKYCLAYSLFQSPSSVWRTMPHCGYCGPLLRYFNPRPPCGVRPVSPPCRTFSSSFQSTSSVWRTTVAGEVHQNFAVISIRVLRVEDDHFHILTFFRHLDFNPRPPCGGRQTRACTVCSSLPFQSPSSVWRTTYTGVRQAACHCISIPVLRVEDDCQISTSGGD